MCETALTQLECNLCDHDMSRSRISRNKPELSKPISTWSEHDEQEQALALCNSTCSEQDEL